MRSASPSLLVRRRFLAALAAMACVPAADANAAGREKVVTILGDSITAGYGLRAAEALPAQLERSLTKLGAKARVRGAGVSGDTSAGGAARVDFSVQSDTAVAVVALGGNDMLQGLSPEAMQANLTRIVRRLKARRIKVVLCGLRAPASLNAHYARDFNAVFPAVARAEAVALYPNLLAGVELNGALNQSDGIHPNPRGVKIIARALAPTVARALVAA
jgi:acyl-CoA thioesterase-1